MIELALRSDSALDALEALVDAAPGLTVGAGTAPNASSCNQTRCRLQDHKLTIGHLA